MTTPNRKERSESAQRVSPVLPLARAASRTRPADKPPRALPAAQKAVRKPKYLPRTDPGTSSAIQVVQALFPATPRTAQSAAKTRSTVCLAASGRETNGSGTRRSGSVRDARRAASAVHLLPRIRVTHAQGSCASWAAKGSAPRTPTSKGEKSTYSAQAVRTLPVTVAPTTSAAIPSQVEMRKERRVLLMLSEQGAMRSGATRKGYKKLRFWGCARLHGRCAGTSGRR